MEILKKFSTYVFVFLMMGLLFVFASIQYSLSILQYARSTGVYATQQELVTTSVQKYYRGVKKIEFEHVGSNSFDGSNPHVGYVMYTVYAGSHTDGTPLRRGAFEHNGHFVLHMKDGWVSVGEGFFPEFIGFWMKVIGVNGS